MLDEISRETDGLRFEARPRADGRLVLSGAEMKRLRELLDRHVVGHDEAKQALLLALVCREHIYLEGPPGSAKTRMAELAARGASLGFFFYQMHRDTRLSELVGDVVLERRPLAEGEGERIHQAIEPGGILTAEVCVLDDISRAPGEALNVLLRVLNERKFGERPIPLLTAIATSNPLRDEYYNEPLDPANLDRFAIQLRVSGLIQSGDRAAARALVDRFADGSGRRAARAGGGARAGRPRPALRRARASRRARRPRRTDWSSSCADSWSTMIATRRTRSSPTAASWSKRSSSCADARCSRGEVEWTQRICRCSR